VREAVVAGPTVPVHPVILVGDGHPLVLVAPPRPSRTTGQAPPPPPAPA
jgi:hypothetical protein